MPTLYTGCEMADPLFLGLDGYWTCDDDPEGGANVADRIGGRHLARHNGVGSTTGKITLALLFDGSGAAQYLDNATPFANTGALSVALWFKTTDPGGAYDPGVGLLQSAAGTHLVGDHTLAVNVSGKVVFSRADGDAYVGVQSVAAVTDDAWHHAAGVWDGSSLVLYLDGAATNGGAASYDATITGLMIGDNGIPFDGAIDEIGHWSRALSAAEVAALYNAGAGHRPVGV